MHIAKMNTPKFMVNLIFGFLDNTRSVHHLEKSPYLQRPDIRQQDFFHCAAREICLHRALIRLKLLSY